MSMHAYPPHTKARLLVRKQPASAAPLPAQPAHAQLAPAPRWCGRGCQCSLCAARRSAGAQRAPPCSPDHPWCCRGWQQCFRWRRIQICLWPQAQAPVGAAGPTAAASWPPLPCGSGLCTQGGGLGGSTRDGISCGACCDMAAQHARPPGKLAGDRPYQAQPGGCSQPPASQP